MKLSFSTRGWQHLSWEETIATAEDSGLAGIEVYDLPKREDLYARGGAFHRYNVIATMEWICLDWNKPALAVYRSRSRAARTVCCRFSRPRKI